MKTVKTFCILALFLANCQRAPSKTFGDPEIFNPYKFEGIWQTNGYGQVTKFLDGRILNYSVTDSTCVPEPEGELGWIDFVDQISKSDDGQTIHLWTSYDLYPIEYKRIDRLDTVCKSLSVNTPIGNFDAFVDYFSTHYAFFDLYDVDWSERAMTARTQIDDTTSDQALFDIMRDAILPLTDAHLGIDADIDGEAVFYDSNPGVTETSLLRKAEKTGQSIVQVIGEFRMNYWFNGIKKQILGGESIITGNGRIQYGMAADNVGYFAVVTMGGYIDGELASIPDEDDALNVILEEIIDYYSARNAEAVILDLSMNSGGYDFAALTIADRFVRNEVNAFSKIAYDSQNQKPYTYRLGTDKTKSRFEGDVYVMVSDLTVSAGEMIPLSLRALDHVTIVGQPTRGALSTVLTKYLPNGWSISLSNEIYTDRYGQIWEGKGIPPDIQMPIFDSENPDVGHIEAVKIVANLASNN